MTDKVNPTLDGNPSSQQTAAAIRFAGGSSDGWIVPAGSDPANIATDDDVIDETALNAFTGSHSSSSFDVTVDPGQAYVGGAWLARDITTTVTLDASTVDQTVYAGWDVTSSNTVLIGTASEFDPRDPRLPLFDFDTDSSGVTAVTDRRNLDGYRIANDVVEGLLNLGDAAFSGYPLDSEDLSNAAVTQAKIAAGAVGSGEIATGAVGSDEIATDAVGSGEIATGAVGSDEVEDGSVGQGDLGFDPATQTELDNHEANSSAHHARPGSTQTTGISGGYISDQVSDEAYRDGDDSTRDQRVQDADPRDATEEFEVESRYADGFRMLWATGGGVDLEEIEVRRDGTWVTIATPGTSNSSSSWDSWTFNEGQVDKLRFHVYYVGSVDGTGHFSIFELELHTVALPEHSHQI
ncbi:hypothetical protein [Halosimplex sp. J119]